MLIGLAWDKSLVPKFGEANAHHLTDIQLASSGIRTRATTLGTLYSTPELMTLDDRYYGLVV